MRRIHYIGGLPRSGSTLLTNILLQNPKFATTATSSLLDFLLQVRDNWNKLEGHKVYEEGQDKWAVIRAIMQNYHKTDKEVIFDKNRGWSTHIEFIEKATGAQLHRFSWINDERIGELPREWNWLPDEYGPNPDAKLLHYTLGTPCFTEFATTPMGDEWHRERMLTDYCLQRTDI